MELFGIIGWISVPQFILQYVNIPAGTLPELIANERLIWWITLGVAGGLYLLGLIFGGFGLMKIAKRAGVKHGWIGFLPFANTYLAGKLAGEARLFNTRIKHIGLIAMIFEIAFVLYNLFFMILQLVVLDPAFWEAGAQSTETQIVYVLSQSALEVAGMGWIYTALGNFAVSIVLDMVNLIFSLLVLYLFCTLFFAFYRKYYVRSPFLMTFLSAVLPGRGFAIFAVRNNQPIDYAAYMRRRMQQQYQQQPPYGGYGPQGGYNNPQNGGYYPPQSPSAPPEEPFGPEFGGTPAGGSPQGGTQGTPPPSNDDPFSDF